MTKRRIYLPRTISTLTLIGITLFGAGCSPAAQTISLQDVRLIPEKSIEENLSGKQLLITHVTIHQVVNDDGFLVFTAAEFTPDGNIDFVKSLPMIFFVVNKKEDRAMVLSLKKGDVRNVQCRFRKFSKQKASIGDMPQLFFDVDGLK